MKHNANRRDQNAQKIVFQRLFFNTLYVEKSELHTHSRVAKAFSPSNSHTSLSFSPGKDDYDLKYFVQQLSKFNFAENVRWKWAEDNSGVTFFCGSLC